MLGTVIVLSDDTSLPLALTRGAAPSRVQRASYRDHSRTPFGAADIVVLLATRAEHVEDGSALTGSASTGAVPRVLHLARGLIRSSVLTRVARTHFSALLVEGDDGIEQWHRAISAARSAVAVRRASIAPYSVAPHAPVHLLERLVVTGRPLTIASLADAMGRSRRRVHAHVTGAPPASLRTLLRVYRLLCRVYGVSTCARASTSPDESLQTAAREPLTLHPRRPRGGPADADADARAQQILACFFGQAHASDATASPDSVATPTT
jgi:hypothetical protein